MALLSAAMAGGIALLALSALQGGPWAFVVLWLIVLGGVSYGLLFLTCRELAVREGVLYWQSAFRHGNSPMIQVERIASWPGGSVHVFCFQDGTKVRVGVMQGYIRFLRELHEEYPQLTMPPAFYARFVDHIKLGEKQSERNSAATGAQKDQHPTG